MGAERIESGRSLVVEKMGWARKEGLKVACACATLEVLRWKRQ
jgi:hypothetical protein